MKIILGMALLLVAISQAQACYHDPTQKAKFVKKHPCPSPHGKTCPGFIVDHKHALCVGGADVPENMVWMTVANAKLKDRWECKPGWEKKLAECERNGCFL